MQQEGAMQVMPSTIATCDTMTAGATWLATSLWIVICDGFDEYSNAWRAVDSYLIVANAGATVESELLDDAVEDVRHRQVRQSRVLSRHFNANVLRHMNETSSSVCSVAGECVCVPSNSH